VIINNYFDSFKEELIKISENGTLVIGDLDIDFFKNLNDQYGRDCGDRILEFVEDVLKKNLPESVKFKRFSDEYFVYTTDCSLESLFMELQEIKKTIASSHITYSDKWVTFTISGTVGELNRNAASIEKMMNILSEGLRNSKQAGRNTITFAPMEREQKMILKSSYYLKSELEGLTKLSKILERTESSLLREALDDLLRKYEL
jgi:diguanylate cyclase (GGDEF)-like protein